MKSYIEGLRILKLANLEHFTTFLTYSHQDGRKGGMEDKHVRAHSLLYPEIL